MRGELPRRWRWVIGAGCMIVMTLAGLLFGSDQEVEPPPPLPEVARASEVPSMAESASPIDQPLASASMPASHGADEVEVCGGGWVRLPDVKAITAEQAEIGQAAFEREYERATQLPQRRAELLAALRASPDEFTAAAASLLEAALLYKAGDQAAAYNMFDAFMRGALTTRNPKVYALAFKECGRGAVQEDICRMVSARQWARLDPDNAAPWMFLLGSADTSNAAAADEALHRIATAARSDMYFLSGVTALTDSAPPGEKSLPALFDIVFRSIGIEAAHVSPPYQPLVRACSSAALRDANRAQTCEAVAEVMTERSTSLLEQRIGLGIGKRLGWSLDRIDRIRGESEAYRARRAEESKSEMDVSCGKLAREVDSIKTMARLGETGEVRAWVATSGKKPEEFIRLERARERKYQESLAAQQREEAASAAAASAAAAPR